MKKCFPLVARLLLGAMFFIFGLNGFLNFMPPPPSMPEKAMAFMTGLGASGYFFPFLKGTEVICGLLLLSNVLVPLALVVLAPIVLNILCVHTFLMPESFGLPFGGLIMPLVIAGLQIYLSFFVSPYKDVIKPLFCCKKCSTPTAS